MEFTLVHVDELEPKLYGEYADFGQLLRASIDPSFTLGQQPQQIRSTQ